MMTDGIMQDLLDLAKESAERDAKIETTLTFLDKRLESMEVLTSKMSETLNEQKHLATVIDRLTVKVNGIEKDIENARKDIEEIRIAPAKNLHTNLKKVLWIVIPMALSPFVAMVMAHIIKHFGGN